MTQEEPNSLAALSANLHRFLELGQRYESDADFRARMDAGDTEEAVDFLGINLPAETAAKLHFDTAEVAHIPIPPDPNEMLADESLMAIAGGKTAGTAGSAGTASTLGCSCVPSTVSTASSLATVGTAGGSTS